MNKAERFIQDYTKTCCNIEYTKGYYPPSYQPWLTPDQALKAVEIAKEEIYEWLNKNLSTYIGYQCRGVGESVEEFVGDLKRAMKDG